MIRSKFPGFVVVFHIPSWESLMWRFHTEEIWTHRGAAGPVPECPCLKLDLGGG